MNNVVEEVFPCCGYGQLVTDLDIDELAYLFEALPYQIKILEDSSPDRLDLIVLTDTTGNEIVFEQVERDEYIFVLEADSPETLHQLSTEFSNVFSQYKIDHRVELYDSQDQDVGYVHYNWPKHSE